MSMLDVIKQAARASEEAQAPAAVLYGQVLETGPLRVNVDARFDLPESLLVLPEHLGQLRPGDRLLLLRNRGGGEYIVMGKVRTQDDT